MSKQRIWLGVRGKTMPVAFMSLLMMSTLLGVVVVASSADDVGDVPVQVDPALNIRALCDQSVRNYRLLTPQTEDDTGDTGAAADASDRHCACKMVHEAPWGAPKIEIDCSALDLQSDNIVTRHLPFGSQTLDVSWNGLLRVPKFETNVKQLQFFKLNNNHIERIQQGDLAELTYLEELDLSNNAIREIEPAAFNDLTMLKRLNLAYNSLRSMPEYIFRRMTNILHLSLSGNHLTDLLLEKNLFYNFQLHAETLQVLELEYCDLSWLSVESGSALVEIRLRGNAFYKQLPLLPKGIKLLDLSANPIRRLDNTFYNGQLNDLEILLLEDMSNLYILDVSSMATFHSLRKLSLQGSRNFTYLNELAFDCVESEHQENDSHIFEQLNEIVLTGTKVRRVSEKLHGYMPNIEFLALEGCPMQCDCDLKWLMGRRQNITTNGICEKPLTMKNKLIDEIKPENIQNCSNFSRFMFKIMNMLLILLMIVICGVAMYYLVMGCRPSKKFYIRQRMGINSPYSRITVEPIGQSYRPTTISQA